MVLVRMGTNENGTSEMVLVRMVLVNDTSEMVLVKWY